MVMCLRFLITTDVGEVICLNASIAFSDRYSCTKLTTAASPTITMIMIASRVSPKTAEMTVAASSIIISGEPNCFAKTAIGECVAAFRSSFFPYSFCLIAVSSSLRPSSSALRWDRTCSLVNECQDGLSSTVPD